MVKDDKVGGSEMKIYTNNEFTGVWPVGTAGVVIAKTKEDAKTYLDIFLAQRNLPDSEIEQFKEMDFKEGEVRILRDGEY